MSPETPGPNANLPSGNLPVAPAWTPPHRPEPAGLPGAAFICQLIAERQHLPTQRARRRVPVAIALDCYASTGQQAVRRMPAGYRKSVLI